MERQSVARPYSEKFVAGSSDYDLFANKNVDWMSDGPFTKVFYVLAVLTLWALVHVSRAFSPPDCWTVVNIVHGVVSKSSAIFQLHLASAILITCHDTKFLDYVCYVSLGERMS